MIRHGQLHHGSVMMRRLFALLAVLSCSSAALAGHTRPGYVDGCQSADGRFVVTAESKKQPDGKDGWQFTWKDTKTGTTHTGWLVGLPCGLEHFKVAYAHIFVPPGGETFAVFQTANWTGAGSKPPDGKEKEVLQNPPDEFKTYAGFADRVARRTSGRRMTRTRPTFSSVALTARMRPP